MASSQIQLPDPNSPTIQQFQSDGAQFLEHAAAYIVEDDGQLEAAIAYARDIARGKATIESFFKPIKQSIDATKKVVLSQEQALLRPFLDADVKLRARITVYQVEREAKQKAEARAAAIAEQKRLDDEKLERAAALQALAESTGDAHYLAAADAELDAPTRHIPMAVARPAVRVPMREEVSVDVHDVVALARAVADGLIEPSAITANTTWLRREAIQRGESFNIPGVRRLVTKDVTIRR